MAAPRLVEHFFRHEYGRLVATLTNRVGVEHIDDIEDAVQSALMTAIENWTIVDLPDNPSAWLFRVANNHLLGELRKRTRRRRILRDNSDGSVEPECAPNASQMSEPEDDLLRMLFVCCDEAIPVESQVVFALKDQKGVGSQLSEAPAGPFRQLTPDPFC